MKLGTRVALAIGAGYVLGRRRKLRPALTLAAAVAAGRASRNAPGLLKYGSSLLSSSPALGSLTTMSEPLASAGKAAATAAIGSGVDALSERLRDRADALRNPAPRRAKAESKSRGRPADDVDDHEEQDDEAETWDDEADDDTGYDADESDESDESDEDEPDEDDEADDDEPDAVGPDTGAKQRGSTVRRTASAGTRRRK